jgi:hypothetical protein
MALFCLDGISNSSSWLNGICYPHKYIVHLKHNRYRYDAENVAFDEEAFW